MGLFEKSPVPTRHALIPFLSVLASALLAACSCDGSGATQLAPKLEFDGVETENGSYLIDFGAVSVGSKATVDFQIKNGGSAKLELELDGPETPFEISLDRRLSLPVGASLPATLSFTPHSEGPFETVLSFQTNGAGTHELILRGTGTTPAIVCNPSPVDFGPVAQGSSRSLAVTCHNDVPARLVFQLGQVLGKDQAAFEASVQGQRSPEPVDLGPGESVVIDVTFYGVHLGPNQATLSLDGVDGGSIHRLNLLAEVMSSFIAFDPSSCLDFGPVEIGGSRILPLGLQNLGGDPVTISSLEVPANVPFRVLTEAPVSLEPGAKAEIEVEFTPEEPGNFQGELTLRFDDSRLGTVSTCLRGIGGGPRLSCAPATVDFGPAALNIPTVRKVLCTNTGNDSEGDGARLFLDEIESTSPLFTAEIRNADGSTSPALEGYGVGEHFTIEVTYLPIAEGHDEGELLVSSNSVLANPLVLPVSGNGRDLPPCRFTLRPPSLRFGNTQPGEEATLDFAIRNDQATECIVSNVELVEDSHPAFRLVEIESHVLGGHEELRVPVTFAPDEHFGRVHGTVRFTVSDPADMHHEVALQGASEEPCLLVEPTDLDFGAVEPGCQSREREVRVYNICQHPITLTGVEIADSASSSFTVSQVPLLPKTLKPGDQEQIHLLYQAQELGEEIGAFFVEVEGREPYMGRMRGAGEAGAWQTDRFSQEDKPKVDVLFVIDNSLSMYPYQNAIAQNLPAFLHHAQVNRVDFQIGVTTSGLTATSPGTEMPCPGGAAGGEDGRLFPVDNSYPRILTPYTPNLEAAWRHNVMVGECHSQEYVLEAAKRALSSPTIDHADDPRYPDTPNDGNLGFLRPDAALTIIFVTDEMEQSPDPVVDYLTFFRSIKGSRYPHLFKAHAITTPRGGECTKDDGTRLIEFVNMSGGVFQSLCQQDWSQTLETMSRAAFGFTVRFQLGNHPAVLDPSNPEGIEVRVDGKLLAPKNQAGQTVWEYDPLANTIDFSPNFVPPPGSEIEVRYQAVCMGG